MTWLVKCWIARVRFWVVAHSDWLWIFPNFPVNHYSSPRVKWPQHETDRWPPCRTGSKIIDASLPRLHDVVLSHMNLITFRAVKYVDTWFFSAVLGRIFRDDSMNYCADEALTLYEVHFLRILNFIINRICKIRSKCLNPLKLFCQTRHIFFRQLQNHFNNIFHLSLIMQYDWMLI
jgi:hypothetical protein